VIRDFRTDLDEPLDEPFHRPLDFFLFQVEFSEHVQKIVGQDAHKQASLVGCEFTATRLVPTQSNRSLFDPILNVTSAVLDFDHFPGGQPGVGDDETDPWKELPHVPFDLGYHPTRSVPCLRLIPKVNQLDLNPTLRGPSHRTC
jgi:hypothetical protein